jgi:glucuronoarabinoxylan endo-1,4-beta-xylanase
VTNSFERISKVLTLLALLFAASAAKAQTATINWTDQHQQIQGFGAADQLGMFSNQPLTSTQAQLFFSQANGIGLSILREGVPEGSGGSGALGSGNCSSSGSSCATSTAMTADMQLALAQNPNLKIFTTAFTAPASMKSNGQIFCTTGSGNGTLDTGSYSAFAIWLENWVTSLNGIGITPYAVSIDNEPDFCGDYDSMLLPNTGFTSVIDDIGSSLGSTLVMMPESSNQTTLTGYADNCFSTSCGSLVGIVATHGYSFTEAPTSPYSTNGYWETEISGCATSTTTAEYTTCAYTGAMNPDGLFWAYDIWNWMTYGNANAWVFWAMIPYSSPYPNTGLMNPDGVTIPQRLWAVGNYSKFIQPGYVRIDCPANPQSGIYLSCYQNTSTSNLVIVAINNGGSNVSQSFSITNGPTFTSVMPWVTSASQNLAQQSAVSVSTNSFSYTLAASSVTTFVGSSSTATPPQTQSAAPTAPVITSVVVK